MGKGRAKILIITRYSFGYQPLPYNWCLYLSKRYDITCLCLDDPLRREPITVEGVKVKYVHSKSGRLSRYVSLLRESFKTVREGFDLCIVMYFPGCSIFKLLNPPSRKFILDIQSGAVGSSKIMRALVNGLLRLDAMFFRYKFVLSGSLGRKLHISTAYIIPIGATSISHKEHTLKRLDLLYVGTLQNRDIDKTIEGFAYFHARYKDEVGMSYTIVGNGYANQEDELKRLAHEKGLDRVVTFTGYVATNKIAPFFDNANVGVSFIPMTDYYDVQPPTKTFEYLVSGMPVLATNTTENRCLINNSNGVLIDDTPEGFYQGLKKLYERRHLLNSKEIREQAKVHSWENITNHKLIPFLDAVLKLDEGNGFNLNHVYSQEN